LPFEILFVTENFPAGGHAAATRVYERASYWVKAGHEVTVLTCFPNFPQGNYIGLPAVFVRRQCHGRNSRNRLPTYVARNEGFFRRTLDFVSFMMGEHYIRLCSCRGPDVVWQLRRSFSPLVAGWVIGGLKRRPFRL